MDPVVARTALFLAVSSGCLYPQDFVLWTRPEVRLPAPIVDGNSPGVWIDGQLRVYTSTGAQPMAMTGATVFQLGMTADPVVSPRDHYPLWIEAAWRDDDGRIFAWYHHEPSGVCGSSALTAPRIGALASDDGGRTFRDLGIVLASGDPLDCAAQNGFFAGGHGDFSVIPDTSRQYFYFLFTNYGGAAEAQGVSLARMAFEDRANPAGKVWKLHADRWESAGVGGPVTPVFPATIPWNRPNAESFWGPSVHWNSYLLRYVVVMNRACCAANWQQEGIWLTSNHDLNNPFTWQTPQKLLDDSEIGFAPGYYPQLWGSSLGETDSAAGQAVRLYVKGVSSWEILFTGGAEAPPPAPSRDPVPGIDPRLENPSASFPAPPPPPRRRRPPFPQP